MLPFLTSLWRADEKCGESLISFAGSARIDTFLATGLALITLAELVRLLAFNPRGTREDLPVSFGGGMSGTLWICQAHQPSLQNPQRRIQGYREANARCVFKTRGLQKENETLLIIYVILLHLYIAILSLFQESQS